MSVVRESPYYREAPGAATIFTADLRRCNSLRSGLEPRQATTTSDVAPAAGELCTTGSRRGEKSATDYTDLNGFAADKLVRIRVIRVIRG